MTHTAGTLTVDKTGPATAAHGATITYTMDVTYAPGADGSPAQNIVVSDDQCTSAVSAPNKSTAVDPDNDADAFLETGETWRYTCTYTVPARTRTPKRIRSSTPPVSAVRTSTATPSPVTPMATRST